MQSDPIGLAGGINTYLYANANPILYIDPAGLTTTAVGGVIGGFCGGPFGAAIGAGIGSLIGVAGYYYFNGPDCGGNDGGGDDSEGEGCDNDGDPCKGLRKQLQEHERKLREFMANPDAHDNKGFLANSPPNRRQKIIDGRIRNLRKQIENFRKLLQECERRHGAK